MLNSQSVVLIHLPKLPLYVGSISSIGIRYHLLSHQTKQASSDNPRYWPVIFSPRIPGIVSLQVTSWPTGRRKRLGRGEYCPNRFLVLKHWNPNEPWRKYPGWLVTNQGLILYIYIPNLWAWWMKPINGKIRKWPVESSHLFQRCWTVGENMCNCIAQSVAKAIGWVL